MTTWDARLKQLRSPTGELVTEAQDAKANRYLKLNAIQEGGVLHPDVPWGQPSLATRTYTLLPIPGCKEHRRVVASMHYDADDKLVNIVYECDCQRSANLGRTCSHVVAVHRYRTRDNSGDSLEPALTANGSVEAIAEDASRGSKP